MIFYVQLSKSKKYKNKQLNSLIVMNVSPTGKER